MLPVSPKAHRVSGLDTANQNGITSLNANCFRLYICRFRTIAFIFFSLLFESAAAIARVIRSLSYARHGWTIPGSLRSQRLHLRAPLKIGWPFAWNDNLWFVKPPRSLLKQMSSGVKFDLIKDQNLSRDKPDCETDHDRPQRESSWKLDHFHASS